MMKLTYAPSGIGSGIHNRNPEEEESIDPPLIFSENILSFFVPQGLNLNMGTKNTKMCNKKVLL